MNKPGIPQPPIGVILAALLLAGCGATGVTPTSPTEPQISFTADRTSLAPGECATLQWSVEGGLGVDFGGEPVDRSGQRRVCPPETTTFWLGVDTGEAVARRQVVISVRSPGQPPGAPSGPTPSRRATPAGAAGEEELPDLTVTEVSSSPAAPRAGEVTALGAVIKNLGTWDAEDFFVSFLLDGAEIGSVLIGRLSAGAEGEATVRVTSPSAGEHRLDVIANPGGWIREADESNNALRRSLVVEGAQLPDLVIESLTVQPESPAPGDPVAIAVTIRNRGTGAAEQASVAFSIMGAADLEGLEQGECSPEDRYAVEVVDSARANPDSDPSAALGPPDFSEEPARGCVNLGIGGSITLALGDSGVMDGPGDDLRIWGAPRVERSFHVELSEDGTLFYSLGLVRAGTDLDLAASGVAVAWLVRITDDGSPEREGTASPGTDLDAVEALHCLPLDRDPLKLDHVELLTSLEPGGRETVTVSWTSTSAGEYTLVAEIDALDSVPESDETNNALERVIAVRVK
ncbi:MAG TPA: CARDB domain-containing protein [Anaerolineae bacterium]|nr:CARDB domain-containing protein [Anaerolineae bacterium]